MQKNPSTNIYGSGMLANPAFAVESPSESAKWVVRMTVDITDLSGVQVISASTKTTLTGNASNATGTERAELLTIALDSLDASAWRLSSGWKAITDTTNGP